MNAHLDLTKPVPEFNFYDEEHRFFTRPRFLPSSKISDCHITQSIFADGCIILGARIENSVIGIRSFISPGTQIYDSIVMGNSLYETIDERNKNQENGIPNLGLGSNCVVRNSIIDMDCRIGDNVQLINRESIAETFQDNYAIRDGIIIVPKGSVIARDTII
jgi:glucose-1-phosphate adenylyltransferase